MRTVLIILFLLTASFPRSGTAATVTISPSGGGVYLLAGQALQNVSGLDITITYNAAALSSPRVSSGGLLNGALLMANTSRAGTIRVAAVHQGVVKGSGLLATISFDASDLPGGGQDISGLKVTAISPQGVKSQVPAIIADPAGTGSEGGSAGAGGQAAEQATQQTTTPPVGTAASSVVLPAGMVIASVPARPSNQNEQPLPAVPDQETPQVPGALDRAKEQAAIGTNEEKKNAAEQRRILAGKSVLERFREFRDPWTVREAKKRFRQDPLLGYGQEPQIALSDGKTMVVVTVVISPGSKGKPALSLRGGSILSAERDREKTNTWAIKTMPDRDALDVVLSVDDGHVVRHIPLTVAPRTKVDLDGSGKVTEKDFALYGRQRSRKGEKERNVVDDYVFAANYLVAAGLRTGEKTGVKEGKGGSSPAGIPGDAPLITRQ